MNLKVYGIGLFYRRGAKDAEVRKEGTQKHATMVFPQVLQRCAQQVTEGTPQKYYTSHLAVLSVLCVSAVKET